MNQKGFMDILIVFAVALFIGVGVYINNNNQVAPTPDSSPISKPNPVPNPAPSSKPNQTEIPDPIPKSDIITVALGEKFTLGNNQMAKVKGLNVSLKVTGFVYSPCPEGARCVWSGLAVNYELTVDGKVVTNFYDTPYDINEIKTDYKTFTTVTLTNAVDECYKEKGDGCLDALAKRFKDPIYCNKMTNPVGKGYCLDNLKKN